MLLLWIGSLEGIRSIRFEYRNGTFSSRNEYEIFLTLKAKLMRHIVSPDSATIFCTRDPNAEAFIFKWKKLTRNLLDLKIGLFVCFCTDCKHPLMNNENKFCQIKLEWPLSCEVKNALFLFSCKISVKCMIHITKRHYWEHMLCGISVAFEV